MMWANRSARLPAAKPARASLTFWSVRIAGIVACASLLAGCAGRSEPQLAPRSAPFSFEQDTFPYANELAWEYSWDDATGEMSHSPRQPPPEYSHHCFVVARSARQFFAHARFDPDKPKTTLKDYRQLVRRVIAASPRRESPATERIIIPGYAHLREFGADYEALLKAECGGAWESYFQRGHWRMLLPFTQAHQHRMALQLLENLSPPQPLVVHAVRFPSLSINHALVVYSARETEHTIEFDTYDPNTPDTPVQLTYDRSSKRFRFPHNAYFKGGRVDIYQVFHSWNY